MAHRLWLVGVAAALSPAAAARKHRRARRNEWRSSSRRQGAWRPAFSVLGVRIAQFVAVLCAVNELLVQHGQRGIGVRTSGSQQPWRARPSRRSIGDTSSL